MFCQTKTTLYAIYKHYVLIYSANHRLPNCFYQSLDPDYLQKNNATKHPKNALCGM